MIAVQVDNLRAMDRIPVVIGPDWSFDWWNYGGITRDVSLEITNRAYISHQKVVPLPHLTGMHEADTAQISASITLNNASDHAFDGTIRADLLDDTTGLSVLTSLVAARVSIPANSSADAHLEVMFDSPKLWHFAIHIYTAGLFPCWMRTIGYCMQT